MTNNQSKFKKDSLYESLLTHYPIPTKSLTSFIISFFGSLASQKLQRVPFNFKTAFKFALTMLLGTPLLHYWYIWLEKVSSSMTVRLLLDQLPFSAFLNSFVMLVMGLLNGASFGAIGQSIKQDIGHVMVKNVGFWLPVQLVNLKYVPMQYRLLFGNVFGFVWSIILSLYVGKNS